MQEHRNKFSELKTLAGAKFVLIVEDNLDDYEVISNSFKDPYGKILTIHCKTGGRALDFLDECMREHLFPSVIVLNTNIRGMDGKNFAAYVRMHVVFGAIPLVVITDDCDQGGVLFCYKLGASVVQKSLRVDEFSSKIQKIKDYWFECCLLPNPA